jgi:hypothetical protein
MVPTLRETWDHYRLLYNPLSFGCISSMAGKSRTGEDVLDLTIVGANRAVMIYSLFVSGAGIYHKPY